MAPTVWAATLVILPVGLQSFLTYDRPSLEQSFGSACRIRSTIQRNPMKSTKKTFASSLDTKEQNRLNETRESGVPWKKWGPYLSERQWGTVREDYSEDGNAWDYFSHEQ